MLALTWVTKSIAQKSVMNQIDNDILQITYGLSTVRTDWAKSTAPRFQMNSISSGIDLHEKHHFVFDQIGCTISW